MSGHYLRCRSGLHNVLYLLDANVLITAHHSYYPVDTVPEFWTWLAHHAAAGTVKIPSEIFFEVKDGGMDREKDLLFDWIQQPDTKAAILLKEEPDLKLVRKVTEEGYAHDLTDVEIEKVGRDPFLIAYGLAGKERCVITAEVSEPKKQRANKKVPDVCDFFGVQRNDLFFITKQLKFATHWNK